MSGATASQGDAAEHAVKVCLRWVTKYGQRASLLLSSHDGTESALKQCA